MFSNFPPLGASQVQTLGGLYEDLPPIGGPALGDQAQNFKQHLFAHLRCIGRSIVLGGDLNQVAPHEFQTA